MNFKDFLESDSTKHQTVKPWVAKRKDIIELWRNVRSDAPLSPTPVPKLHKGNRFDQDGIRITGSSQWINSVLGRIKAILAYENHPSLELDVKYRQVQKRDLTDKPSFACYINVVEKKSD